MTEKKYYWLKMEGNFFDQKEIRKLRRVAGGDTYVIIYLKMSLLSLKDDGKIYYEGVEDTFAEELAEELRESTENVKMTIAFLEAHNMLESHNSDELYMNRIPEMTGSETDSAKRKRRQRLRAKTDLKAIKSDNVPLICDNVQKSHIEKKIDLEIDVELEKNKNEAINKHFNVLWLMYPSSRRPDGKKKVTAIIKKKLFNITKEEWSRVLDRYKKDYPDYKFWKHCFRFMNNESFNIYLDENWEEPEQKKKKEYDQEPRTPEEREYFYQLRVKDQHSDLWNNDMEERLLRAKEKAEQSLNPKLQEQF